VVDCIGEINPSRQRVSEEIRPRIVVVDYGAGNLRSVARALEASKADVLVTEDFHALESADAVVVPGDGAARSAMEGLARRDLITPIRAFIASGRPFLGVCLGLQVLMSWSDEDGGTECLGIIPGKVVKLPDLLKIPHIGWNQVEERSPHPILDGIADGEDFYFVHSYVAVPDDPNDVVGVTTYGVPFASILQRGTVVATQFHPEKSADAGLLMYRNFRAIVDQSRLAAKLDIRELV
jgi:glutamine amidotransferase